MNRLWKFNRFFLYSSGQTGRTARKTIPRAGDYVLFEKQGAQLLMVFERPIKKGSGLCYRLNFGYWEGKTIKWENDKMGVGWSDDDPEQSVLPLMGVVLGLDFQPIESRPPYKIYQLIEI